MKYVVNDGCIGCGLCAGTCPEVFSMGDEALPSPPRLKSRKKRLSARWKPRMVAPWVPSKKYKEV